MLSYYVNAVVEVNIDMVNVTVPESDPMVEICFSLSSGISESIVITAETAPKDRANQATGTYSYSHIARLSAIGFCTICNINFYSKPMESLFSIGEILSYELCPEELINASIIA